MRQVLSDYRIFWREFRQNFHTTGAVLPSGRSLARSLSRYVAGTTSGRRILEVGPGTGAVTREIVRRLHADDRLDLVELNEQFVRRLQLRFEQELPFSAARDRARILHQSVESLPDVESYDLIVSGLPLNNFSVADVERILEVLMRLLRPGGTLSFFEYIGLRKLKSTFSSQRERTRLQGVGHALRRLLVPHEVRRDWVWPNVPPAWVHHIRRPNDSNPAVEENGDLSRSQPLPIDPVVVTTVALTTAETNVDVSPSGRAGQGGERTPRRPIAVGKSE